MSDHVHGGATQTDEVRARAVREQLKSVHAFDLAYEMAISLVSFGYQKMGLTEETRELLDLGDARLAIELLRAVTETLDTQQAAAPTRDLHATLAQMQLSYASAVEAIGAAAAPPRPETPAAEEVAPAKPAARKPVTKKAAPRKTASKKTSPGKAAPKKAAPKKPRGGAPPAG